MKSINHKQTTLNNNELKNRCRCCLKYFKVLFPKQKPLYCLSCSNQLQGQGLFICYNP